MRRSTTGPSHQRSGHPHRGSAFALAAILLMLILLAAPAARAAVGLTRFDAKAQGNTIVVTWETQSELNTAGFQLFRAESFSPGDWGAPIDQQAAKGGVVPATYTYTDTPPAQGVLYYYLLREVTADSSAGGQWGPVSAGVGLPDQPTATATATATGTVQRTPTRTATVVRTATATRTPPATWTRPPTEAPPPPTATRQFANSPTVPPTASPTFGAFYSGLPTPLPPTAVGTGVVASPTPGAIQPAPALPRIVPTLTPTLFVPTSMPTPVPSETPQPTLPPLLEKPNTREPAITETPEVFEPVRSDDSRRPTPAREEGVRSSNMAFALGGGAIVVALLLGVTGFFVWRARH